MKKWITGLLAALSAVNCLLLIQLVRRNYAVTEKGTTINNTVNGYTTDLTETFDSVKSSVVSVTVNYTRRSGMIYAVDGETTYIFTLASIIDEASPVIVQFDSGAKTEGTLMGMDPETNLALIAVTPGFHTTPFHLGEAGLVQLGEYVLGTGGRKESGQAIAGFGVTSTSGMYLMDEKNSYSPDLFETSINTNPSNLGGPLMNLSGELIGMFVNTPVNGSSAYGYAVSVNELKQVYKQLKTHNSIKRGTLGIMTRPVNQMASYEKNETGIPLSQKTGVVVTNVYGNEETPVFEEDDLILTIDHQTITDHDALKAFYYSHESGDEVSVEFQRHGESQTVRVVLR